MKLGEPHTLDDLEKWVNGIPYAPFEQAKICLKLVIDGLHVEGSEAKRSVNELIMTALSDIIIPMEDHEMKASKMERMSDVYLLVDILGAVCSGAL